MNQEQFEGLFIPSFGINCENGTTNPIIIGENRERQCKVPFPTYSKSLDRKLEEKCQELRRNTLELQLE